MNDTFVLQELLAYDLPFRVHNVKLDTLVCQKDLPMMFLAHYDSLPDDIKAQKPLDVTLLRHMNDKMSASQACTLLSLPQGSIQAAWHIKFTGTTVIVLDDFPLALHLQFTNTAKSSQHLYGKDPKALVQQQAIQYVFAGNVNVLHKTNAKTLTSTDLDNQEYTILQHDGYTRLPNTHALATTHILNTLKHTNPQALDYLTQAISTKVVSQFEQDFG